MFIRYFYRINLNPHGYFIRNIPMNLFPSVIIDSSRTPVSGINP
jgi:hypothetical protein